MRESRPDHLQRLHPVASRHPHIHEDQFRRPFLDEAQPFVGRARDPELVPLVAQKLPE